MLERALASRAVHYRPVATGDWENERPERAGAADSDEEEEEEEGAVEGGKSRVHSNRTSRTSGGSAGRTALLVVALVLLFALVAYLASQSADSMFEGPLAGAVCRLLSGVAAAFDATGRHPAALASPVLLPRPLTALPSNPPASVLSLRSCMQTHHTGRVLVLPVSTSQSASAVASSLLASQSSEVSWCVLLLAQSADVAYSVPSSAQSTVTFVHSSEQAALPYSSSAHSNLNSLAHTRNLAYLLAIHAGAALVVDGEEAAANVSLSALRTTASTFPLGDGSARFTHCQPAVQVVSSALPSAAAPVLPAPYYALNGDADARLLPHAGSQFSTAVMSPAFPLLWLPPSLPASDSAVLRSLAAIPLLSYLQVPTVDAALVQPQHPPAAAARLRADATWSHDSGPSPAQLNQSHIQACLLHATNFAQPLSAPAGPSSTSAPAALLSLLRPTQRGYTSDIQLSLRDTLKREAASTDAAVRASLDLHALVEQLYYFLAASNSSLVTGDDLRSLRAFQDDIRAIRAAVVAQLPQPLVPAAAVVLPRQERVSVCVMFNDLLYWHSLYTVLHQHTALSRYVILSLPNATSTMDAASRQLLASYPNVAVQRCDSHHGYYQHNCLLQCLLQARRDEHDTRGVLWVGDDLFFNVSQLFYYPRRWDVDEFWTHSRSYLMNLTAPWSSYHGAFHPQWKHWVTGIDFHARLQQSYLSWPQQYRDALDSVYGKGRVATEALSDVLYVPAADGQMNHLIDALSVQASSRVDPWCETFTTIAIDIAMVLSGRRPNLPLWPFIDQQFSLYNIRAIDGVQRWIDGVQLYPADNTTDPNLLYNFLRRGAVLTANSTRHWTAEMDSLRALNRTAAHYASPGVLQYQLGGCDADYSGDGYPSLASLRPVPIRPECHLADVSHTPQRSDWRFIRLCAESEGAGWVHPLKMGHKAGERTSLSLELNQRVMLAVSRLLVEGDWTDGRWCERHRGQQ